MDEQYDENLEQDPFAPADPFAPLEPEPDAVDDFAGDDDPTDPLAATDDDDEPGYVKEKTYWAGWKGRDFSDALDAKRRSYFDAARARGLVDRWIIAYAFHHGATPDDLRELATMIVGFGGNELERVRFHINLTRSYNRHAAIIALGEKPAFKAKTINTDHRSLASAELADAIVNGLYSRYYEEHDPEVAEGDGFAGACGTHTRWDFKAGDEVTKDVPVMRPRLDEFGEKIIAEDGKPELEQAVGAEQPVFDEQGLPVVDEFGQQLIQPGEPLTHPKLVPSGAPIVTTVYPWAKFGEVRASNSHLWVCIREPENKWNVIAQFGQEYRDDVLKQNTSYDEYDFANMFKLDGLDVDNEDMLIVEHFYHRRSPAMPDGRYVVRVGDCILWDKACPTKEAFPYSEMCSAKFVETEFPYCDGWDLISLNMALNQCTSDELQNLSLFARQSTYSWKGSNVTQSGLTRGVHYELPADSKPPGAIQLTAMPPTEQFKAFVLSMADRLSGMNGTSRGEPSNNVRSGEMAALLDSISIRYQSFRQQAARRYRVRNAQIIVDMIRRYGDSKFMIDVAGVEDRSYVQEFTVDDLQGVQRVDIDVASPMMQTVSGRMQWYLSLKDVPKEDRPAAYDFVVSGDPDAFMGRDRSAEQLVRRENERLITGSDEVEANATDNPWIHVPKHTAAIERLLASDQPDMEAIERLRKHVLQHWSVYVMYAQPVICGFLNIPPPPPIAPSPSAPAGNAAYVFAQQMAAGQPVTPTPVQPGDTASPEQQQAPQQGAGGVQTQAQQPPSAPAHPAGTQLPQPAQPPGGSGLQSFS